MAAAKKATGRRSAVADWEFGQSSRDREGYFGDREERKMARAARAQQSRDPNRVAYSTKTYVRKGTGKVETSRYTVKKSGTTWSDPKGKPAAPATRVPRSSGPASMKAAGSAGKSARTRTKVDGTTVSKAIRNTRRGVSAPRAGATGGRGNTGGRIGMARGMGRGGSAGKRHGK